MIERIENPISILIIGDYHLIGNFFLNLDVLEAQFAAEIPSMGAAWAEMRRVIVEDHIIQIDDTIFSVTGAYENNEQCKEKAKQADGIIHLQSADKEKKAQYNFDDLMHENKMTFDPTVDSAKKCLCFVAANINTAAIQNAFPNFHLFSLGKNEPESVISHLPQELISGIGCTFFQVQKGVGNPLFLKAPPLEERVEEVEKELETESESVFSGCAIS